MHPALRYHNHSTTVGDKIEWDFFTSGPVEGEFSALGAGKDKDGYPLREWISEDWFFCERARQLGYKTFVDTNIALGHVGLKAYYFSGNQVIRMDSNITCWQNIHGWFDYETLYRRLAATIPEGGRFVEVGCWLGRSIGAFAEFVKKENKTIDMHVVDTFGGEPVNPLSQASLNAAPIYKNILAAHGGNIEKVFRDNMAALKVDVNIHPKTSVEAATEFENESLDAVFIDGDHREASVNADIEAWLPKIKPYGILCGHDFDEAGVSAAVHNNFPPGQVETVGRCWLVQF